MAITVLQAQNNRQAASNAVTVTISTTLGSALVAWSRQGLNNTNTVTMSDSSGTGTWVQTASGYVSGDNSTNRHAMWYKANSDAVTSVTCTWTAGSQPTELVVLELSDVHLATPHDASVNSQAPATTSLTTGNLTTTVNDTILIAGWGAGADQTWGGNPAGYTFPTNGSTVRVYVAYKVVSAIQSAVNVTQTDSASASMASVFVALAEVIPGGPLQPSSPYLRMIH